ncbi:MAG TPA: UpxY family transcription antiterminator [Terriglobales bacterium]|jgi:transcription antitermination factor NusG|nr:UpxY family transcription antiterminator [Terriglobales bacterium]
MAKPYLTKRSHPQMETAIQTRRCWLAAYTRSRHEHQIANQLQRKNVECLLPTYQRLARWSDRVHRSEAPLFPGYVFVHVSDGERVPVLETVGVVHLVSVAGKPAVLADADIERLRSFLSRPGDIEPHPYLRLGQRVRVKHGPFAGYEGVLAEKQNSVRLIITVDQIMKSVAINLHGADVEPLN